MIDDSQVLVLAGIFSLFYLVQKFVAYQQAIRTVKYATLQSMAS